MNYIERAIKFHNTLKKFLKDFGIEKCFGNIHTVWESDNSNRCQIEIYDKQRTGLILTAIFEKTETGESVTYFNGKKEFITKEMGLHLKDKDLITDFVGHSFGLAFKQFLEGWKE